MKHIWAPWRIEYISLSVKLMVNHKLLRLRLLTFIMVNGIIKKIEHIVK